MSSSPPRDRRYFSPISYLALPYIAFFVVSWEVSQCCIPEKLAWIRIILALTWLPATLPFAVLIFGTGVPNVLMMVLQVLFVVGDVYLWAWLITKISEIVAEIRRKEKEFEERNPNVT